MRELELLYRGSLKSCNYQCSYCPFSKRRMSERELKRDQEQWEQFVRTMEENADRLKIRSLMVIPYGEALIHAWYWEGLGRLGAIPGIQATGAQTNLSFSVSESLKCLKEAGGKCEKLYLWATFHPEMVSVEAFSETCRTLLQEGIHLCAGAVGVPKNIRLLQELRAALPGDLYLWINRMDGLRRSYTREETEQFLEIDPYFTRELAEVSADPGQCGNRLFVEDSGKGTVKLCNISRDSPPGCGRNRCSCYLAYGGRRDLLNQVLFGPHPLFRIPRRARAVFLDIAGTLLFKDAFGQEEIPDMIRAGLEGLYRDGVLLFFATTLPYREAMKRCRTVRHLFSGGIFAGGAQIILHGSVTETGERWEYVYALNEDCLSVLREMGSTLCCRILPYRSKERLYKITMVRPDSTQWKEEERRKISAALRGGGIRSIRVFAEDACLQIVSEHAEKAEGVRMICRHLHISPDQTAAAGDSPEDAGMMELCQSLIYN